MALHSAKDPSKLIFAPAGQAEHGQAEQFTRGTLRRADLDPSGSPVAQFHAWFSAARSSGGAVPHPETCCLSTASLPSGRVSARMVYLKELEADGEGAGGRSSSSSGGSGDDKEQKRRGGFVVYSNFGTSRKAADLATNPWASLTFFWEAMERQVRVEGRAVRLSPAESQVYFDTRVRGSRVGAWASRQSQALEPGHGSGGDRDRDDGKGQLEAWVAEAEERFRDTDDIPVPEFWGGLRIVPESVEFWQGGQNRLHDRFLYTRKEKVEGDEPEWTIERLSP